MMNAHYNYKMCDKLWMTTNSGEIKSSRNEITAFGLKIGDYVRHKTLGYFKIVNIRDEYGNTVFSLQSLKNGQYKDIHENGMALEYIKKVDKNFKKPEPVLEEESYFKYGYQKMTPIMSQDKSS